MMSPQRTSARESFLSWIEETSSSRKEGLTSSRETGRWGKGGGGIPKGQHEAVRIEERLIANLKGNGTAPH